MTRFGVSRAHRNRGAKEPQGEIGGFRAIVSKSPDGSMEDLVQIQSDRAQEDNHDPAHQAIKTVPTLIQFLIRQLSHPWYHSVRVATAVPRRSHAQVQSASTDERFGGEQTLVTK